MMLLYSRFSKSFPHLPSSFLKLSHTSFLQKTRHFCQTVEKPEKFDLIVIGGGSGGLACSQEASDFGKKVALLDFVHPSPKDTSWGLGGTCVNVGCIPKKLMHWTSLLGEFVHDAQFCGWNVQYEKHKSSTETKIPSHNWNKLVTAIQGYIKSLNWGYRVALKTKNITYFNAQAKFVGKNIIECTDKRGKMFHLEGKDFVIAVGGRPRYLSIPGALEYAITSDDLFSLSDPPGKTLIIGAGYVALECAGFLTGLGFETAVMARSKYLRFFDQQMATMVVQYMQQHGTRFISNSIPLRIDLAPSSSPHRYRVAWKQSDTTEHFDDFDTILLAVGREPSTRNLGLETIGVRYDPIHGKIPVENEQTNVQNVYALGDVIQDGFELTPVAIQAGRFLARRLYGKEKKFMDYEKVPTTVFTPLEYACCGLSEEKAQEIFGEENIEVYHAYYKPLEWTITQREDNVCYTKILCNKRDNERVVGIHIIGPNSGEIMQGMAIAMKCGATKKDFDDTIGIHPTVAEEVTLLRITKRSGLDPKKTGC